METNYISRDSALRAVVDAVELYPHEYDAIMKEINFIPAADVRPVVRGKWKHDGSDWKNRFICDQCGYK